MNVERLWPRNSFSGNICFKFWYWLFSVLSNTLWREIENERIKDKSLNNQLIICILRSGGESRTGQQRVSWRGVDSQSAVPDLPIGQRRTH
jgi:hypothetical protein